MQCHESPEVGRKAQHSCFARPIFVTLSELASVAEHKKDPLCSTSGWRPAGKPTFEVKNLQRTLKSSTVPMPKTLLRMILNATLPRLIQRALLAALPQELGQYLLACRQGIHIAGACRSHTVPFFSLANCDSMMPQKHRTVLWPAAPHGPCFTAMFHGSLGRG